jgi:hypothetical protein
MGSTTHTVDVGSLDEVGRCAFESTIELAKRHGEFSEYKNKIASLKKEVRKSRFRTMLVWGFRALALTAACFALHVITKDSATTQEIIGTAAGFAAGVAGAEVVSRSFRKVGAKETEAIRSTDKDIKEIDKSMYLAKIFAKEARIKEDEGRDNNAELKQVIKYNNQSIDVMTGLNSAVEVIDIMRMLDRRKTGWKKPPESKETRPPSVGGGTYRTGF